MTVLLAALALAEFVAVVGVLSYRAGQRKGRAAGIRYAAEAFARERAEEAEKEAEAKARLKAADRDTAHLADLAEAMAGES